MYFSYLTNRRTSDSYVEYRFNKCCKRGSSPKRCGFESRDTLNFLFAPGDSGFAA